MMQRFQINIMVGCFIGLFCQISLAQSRQPNFIFILTDDQSYGLMGCTGNPIVQTPNLDQLANEGILFDNAHITSAICTPSRISILLSQYERKHGVNFNSGTSLSEEAWAGSYPVVMRNAGYYTGWIGKNHAPVGDGGYESHVMERSFDYWYAGHGHLSFYPKERHEIFEQANGDTQAEIIGEGAMDFLDNEQKLEGAVRFLQQRPNDKPFLLSVNFNLPHGNGTGSMQQRPSDDDIYKSLYRDLKIPLPEHYIAKNEIEYPKLPPDVLKVENRQNGYNYVDDPASLRERRIRHYQAMTGIDRFVGTLRTKLREIHADQNTVIVFSSDHGLFMGEFGLGGKALCYEKVTHVPLIIYDPNLPRHRQGSRVRALVQSIDIAPTMLAMAGIDIPDSYQGKSLLDIISGKRAKIREYLFTENLWSTQFGNPRCEAVQNTHWKYIRYYKNDNFPALKIVEVANQLGLSPNKLLYSVDDEYIPRYRNYVESSLQGEKPVYEELYNLQQDPREAKNLADDVGLRDTLEEMRKVWNDELKMARGSGSPNVLRYTAQSKLERALKLEKDKNRKPNIIIVLTDDQGWADVGFNGCTDIPTPNLDRLASQGVIFTNGYVSHPYCSPSRAGLLTGRYQARFGHDCNMPYEGENDNSIGIPLDEELISEALKKMGYRTSAIGKWHVGDHPDLHPNNQGFDHWFGFAGGGMNYWGNPQGAVRTILRNGMPVPTAELNYLTDDFTEEAIDFIDKNQDQPFFIYLAYNAPHAPDHATAKYLSETEHIEYGGRSVYAAMVNAVDAGVGRIDSTLLAKGIQENTLIVFLSDNGGRTQYADNRPFRGHKGMLFEGGIKVPFFINYPKLIPPDSKYTKLVTSLDLYPTLLGAAGGQPTRPDLLDGTNLFPFILGEKSGVPHEYFYWRSVGGFEYAVRRNEYKLYKSAYKQTTLLFNLQEDPFERNDIAGQNPDMILELERAYDDWDAQNMAPGWFDPHRENVIKEELRRNQIRMKATGKE